MTRQVTILLLTVAALTALVGGTYVVALRHSDDPLAEDKIVLAKFRILRDIETLRVQQEIEKRKTAVMKAQFTRQERIEQHGGVTFAAVSLAIFWRLSPMVVVVTAISGAGMFLVFRRVPIETPFVKTALPVRHAAAIVERSLTISNAAEYGRALAFSEEITRGRLADTAKLWASLRGGAGAHVLPSHVSLPAETRHDTPGLPSFADIFASRELHGELVLGYEANAPRLGRYEAVHSCLIYGLARSGKTSWLRGLIGQTILTEPDTRCDVLDPHAARADSLAGSLPRTRHFHLIDARDPVPALQAFGAELSRRLLSQDATFPPRILLVDELPALARKPYAKQLQALCETTSQEGRKVNVFLLATAQDLRQKKIGDFRESLSSAYFFKGKPKQVDLFLDDSDATRLYRSHVTHHGIALFSAADEEPRLVAIPECTPSDFRYLESRAALPRAAHDTQSVNVMNASPDDIDSAQANVDRDTVDTLDTTATQAATADSTGDTGLLAACLEICEHDRKTLAARSGVSLSLIKEMQAGRRRVTADTRQKLENVLATQRE